MGPTTVPAGPPEAAGIVFMVLFFGFYALMFLFMMAAMAFWIVALIDCVRREFADPNEKIVWVLVIALAHWIGALIYWFVGRPKGTMPTGAKQPPPTH